MSKAKLIVKPAITDVKAIVGKIDLVAVAGSTCACGCSCGIDG
ncbi:MAG: hypothetical protein WBO66_02610 [Candidatus Moraniibacteriota bacterium]